MDHTVHHEGRPEALYRKAEVKAAPEVARDAAEQDPAILDTEHNPEHNLEHTSDPTPESPASIAAREARQKRDAVRIAEIRDRLLALDGAVSVSENYHRLRAELDQEQKNPQLDKRYAP